MRPRRHFPARRLPLLLLGTFAIFAASIAAAAELTPLVVPLTVNNVGRGDVPVMLNAAGDDVLVRIADLESAGAAGQRWERQKMIAAVATAHTAVAIEGQNAVWLSALRPLVDFQFDSNELSLRVTFDPRLLATTVLQPDTLRPENLVYAADKSTFVNYAISSTSFHSPAVFGEFGHSIHGKLLYSSFSRAADGTFARGLTNFTLDDRSKMRRFTLGDAPVATNDPLGGGALLGGVSVARNFSLDPYFIRQPSLALRGLALSPSTVDVYVNGMLVAQRQIPPGEFELHDIPLATGSGNVRMIVRDAFGGEHVSTSNYYAASNVLAKGISEYIYSVGKIRTTAVSKIGNYEDVAGVASHRIGVTDAFTAGGRVEASRGLVSGGPNVSLRTRFGDLGFSAAASRDDQQSGYAYAIDYRYIARVLSYGFNIQNLSDHYANLSLKAADDRSLVSGTAYVSFAIPYASTTLQYTTSEPRDTSRRNEVSVIASFPIAGRLSGFAQAGVTSQDGRRVRQFTTGVSVYAGRNMTANATLESTGSVQTSTLELVRPLPVGTGFGYRLRANHTEDVESGSGALQYQSPYGRYEVDFDPYHPSKDPSLFVAGGVIAERGRVLFTPPVQDSFALVRVPGVSGVRVYAANQLIGRTDNHGDLLLPSLLAYYGNAIRIDDHDVPLDYQVSAVERVIAPPYRGGAFVDFPVSHIQSIGGVIRVAKGTAVVAPAYGELQLSRDKQTYASPVGTAGEFYFENVPPGRYSALVQWSDGTCRFTIDVPESKDSMLSLGDLICKGSTP